MPKHVDPEHDPLIRDTLAEAVAESTEEGGRQLTQRELGRLKKKKALLAHVQSKQGETRDGTAEQDGERDSKKPRSETDEGATEHVEMDVS